MFNSTNRGLLLAAVLLAGCSTSQPTADPAVSGQAHPVSGQVLYDGKPAAGVSVSFMATGGQGSVLPRATTGPDGTFKLSSFATDDGAPAGSYRVILRWPSEPKPGEEALDADRLMGWYEAGTTTLLVTVKPGENALPPFKLPKRDKPAEAPPGIPGMN